MSGRIIERFRDEHPYDSPRREDGLRPRARALLDSIDFAGRDVVDIGTGRGRLAFLLAPRCRAMVGIDIDPKTIEIARVKLAEAGISRVRFEVMDAESADLLALLPSVSAVVSNLCLSLKMVERAGAALPTGGFLAFTCFHVDQWKETGGGSSHALDPFGILDVAARSGLRMERGFIETDLYRFTSEKSLKELYVGQGSRGRKWEDDGRLDVLMRHAREVQPEVTESYFTALFVK